MSDPTSSGQDVTQLTECPHCGAAVPAAEYCGACGAHLAYADHGAAHRARSYAPFPEEPVLRIAITTSLFPHLSRSTKLLFRLAVGCIVALLVVFALAKWQAPMIGVAACGFPVLYLLYVVEIDDPDRPTFRAPVGIALLLGVVLGVAWGIVGGHYVDRALSLTFGSSLTGADALVAAVVVPVVGVLLMALPVAALRLGRHSSESLDGFVIGAVGALGFGLAATIQQLSGLLRSGQVSEFDFTSTLTQVAIRGFAVPLIGALTIGLFGATLWLRRHQRVQGWQLTLTSPITALAVALVVQVGLGFCEIAVLPDLALLLAYMVAVVLVIVVIRVCLHQVLLAELHPVAIGPPGVCPHCHRMVPTMPYCPHCGVARTATSPRHRSTRAEEGAAAELGGSPARPGSVHYRHVGPGELTETLRLGPWRVFLALLSVMGVASVALVVTSVVLQPPPPKPCHYLFRCGGGPTAGGLVTSGTQYSNTTYGFSLALEFGPITRIQTQSNGIILDYAHPGSSIDSGQVQVVGLTSNGMSASQVVASVQQQVDSNAQAEYAVPNPFIGFQPGAGEAYNYVINGSNNTQVPGRLIILAAVKGNLAIVVLDSGPYEKFSNLDHPSPADQFAALYADPVVNSVKWPSTSSVKESSSG